MFQFINKNKTQLLFCVFGISFLLISFGKHFLFKSAALDLGVFNQAMYKLSMFQSPDITLVNHGSTYFRDHFTPILFLYIPFYKAFGLSSLLVIQVASILLGALAIFKLTLHFNNDKSNAFLSVLFYFLVWGIYSALWFDFHNIVVGATMLPWLFYLYHKNNRLSFILIFVLLIIAKENVSLWLTFIMFSLIITNQSVIVWYKRLEFFLMIFSLMYFVFIVSLVMPHLADSVNNCQLERYNHLGDGVFDILKNLLIHPFRAVALLFGSYSENQFIFEIVKIKFWILFFFGGGFLFLYKFRLIIMLIPIVAQKMFADDVAFWGVHNQYSIEFVPVFSYLFVLLSTGGFISKSKQYIAIVLTAMVTLFVISDKYKHWFEDDASSFMVAGADANCVTENIDIWNKGSLLDIYTGLRSIPKDAKVSATSTLVPHIANREKIYMFPVILDAEYIAIHNTNNTYPLNYSEYQDYTNKLLRSDSLKLIYNKGDLIIFKKFME